jgi:hypothetical protein
MHREIRPGEDISFLLIPRMTTPTMKQVAEVEAKELGRLYRSGMARDSMTGLTRDEMRSRLLRLRGLYGADIERASGVLFEVQASLAI